MSHAHDRSTPDASPQSDAPKIAVAGAACIDMTLRDIPSDWISQIGGDDYHAAPIRRLDQPVCMHLGGNGGAAAYVMGKLGANVELNAPIADDDAGMLVRHWLREANVHLIAPQGDSTMFGITAATGDGVRLGTLQHPSSAIQWHLTAQSDAAWTLIAAYRSATRAEFADLNRALPQFTGTVALDTGVGWMPDIAARQMHDLWQQIDMLIGTTDELAHWTGCDDPHESAAIALQHGPKTIVIKMDEHGAAWQSADEPFTIQPAQPITRGDLSIGAGDAFNGALVVSLARGEPLDSAVSAAQQIAAKVVEVGRGVIGWGENQ
ncbi:MAG: hypothetical protein CMJ49_05725 [Planctomycetaceae bacterium]|nr:hypothetical protein [Planctomycetaceae bacterium]